MARTVRDNSTLSWWLVLLAAVSSILFTFLFARYELDDALIYKRYVDNAFAGQGLVYNVGEYWNALTSPLYAYLFLLLSHVLGSVSYGDVFLRVLSLFVASCGGASLVGLYVENGKDRDLSQASIILLISSSYYFLSTFGLETLLFVGLLGFALVLFAHERYFLLGIVSALLLLTRGESFFLLLLLLLYQIKCKRAWPSWRVFLVPGLILAAHFLFSFAYYGSFTPHTLTAKLAQGASGYWGESLAFAKGIKIYTWYFGHRVSLMFSLALLFCFFGAWRTRAMWQTQAIVGFSFLYAMFFLLFNIPFYHWYYGPFIFFGYLFLVCGVCFCSGALFQRVAALVLVVIVGFQGWYSYQASKSISPHPYVAIGTWLAQNTPQEAKIATAEIGALGWYSKRYMIDILGLVTPGNSQRLKDQKLSEWLSHYEPDFLVVHDPPWPLEEPSLTRLMNESRVSRIDGNFSRGYALWKVSPVSKE